MIQQEQTTNQKKKMRNNINNIEYIHISLKFHKKYRFKFQIYRIDVHGFLLSLRNHLFLVCSDSLHIFGRIHYVAHRLRRPPTFRRVSKQNGGYIYSLYALIHENWAMSNGLKDGLRDTALDVTGGQHLILKSPLRLPEKPKLQKRKLPFSLALKSLMENLFSALLISLHPSMILSFMLPISRGRKLSLV